ncbi:unnamed protein product [Victoria cruziana]
MKEKEEEKKNLCRCTSID